MRLILPIIVFTLTSLVGLAEEGKVSIELIPRLGSGFGEIIEIEGKIVDERDTRLRSHLGKKLLEVHRVGQRKLETPIVIELSIFSFTGMNIPARGTRVSFRGYETGGFTGIPREAFKDIPMVATTSHHFQSRFQITKLLELKE